MGLLVVTADTDISGVCTKGKQSSSPLFHIFLTTEILKITSCLLKTKLEISQSVNLVLGTPISLFRRDLKIFKYETFKLLTDILAELLVRHI